MNFCECGRRKWHEMRRVDGLILCGTCSLPIECEIHYDGDDDLAPHPATCTHIDYIVCDEHLSIATNNVSDRRN